MGEGDDPWPAEHRLPHLDGTQVHLWYARLDWPGWERHGLDSLLSAEERARAARLRLPIVCARFVTGRGLLRRLLGAYLAAWRTGRGGRPAVAPGDIREDTVAATLCFSSGAAGKPALGGPWEASGLEFNLAHSGDHFLFALALRRRLGVDIEAMRPVPDAPALAAGHFAPAEARALACMPEAEHDAAFLSCWTRKEALLKATGEGITRSLARTIVPLAADMSPQRCRIEGDGAVWTLHSLRPAAGTIAALAVEGDPGALRCMGLTPDALW